MSETRLAWREGVTLDRLNRFSRHTLVEHLGIELTAIDDDGLSGSMPVDARHCQPMRLLHGGASVVLAETLASIAANALLPEGMAAVGQEINANHLRSVPEGGRVTGRTRLVHAGNRSQVWNVEIRNDAGQLICVSRVTMAIVTRR